MKKTYTGIMALCLCAGSMSAITPQETPVGKPSGNGTGLRDNLRLSAPMRQSQAHNTFFEGFEDRPEGFTMTQREWLPDGWQDISKTGHTPTSTPHNLTWQVLDEDSKDLIGPVVQNGAFEGYSFAYIMADVAYDGHYDLDEQDEWLITPSIIPQSNDWLYFKMFFNAGWTVYNREKDDFTGQNNSMEIYVSEDGGENWTMVWSLIDDHIKTSYTDEQLRASLIDYQSKDYTRIYVDVKKYAGKEVKFAFRYFGCKGHPVALDNIAVGVPQPVSSFTIPAAAMKQGLSPEVEYPVAPRLYIPYGHELTWTNTSIDALSYEWQYSASDGAAATSDIKDLVTPEYQAFSTVGSPSLTGFFEDNASDPFSTGFSEMQAGGIFSGKDDYGYEGEFGVCFYDLTEPGHKIALLSDYVAFHPDIDEAWETVQGLPYSSCDIDGICNMYPYGGVPYGFDYVDVVALIKETLDPEANMIMRVYRLDANGRPDGEIGMTVLSCANLPEADNSRYVNLRFKFDVPVYVNQDIMVLITNPCRNENAEVVYNGYISFPFVKSQTNYGNSFMYEWCYNDVTGWYDGFFNLTNFRLEGGIFGGILMNLGASYSDMELLETANVDVPLKGDVVKLRVKAHHKPERWAATLDGVTKAGWISHTAVYDENTDTYDVTLNIGENPGNESIDGELSLVSPGSMVTVPFKQPGQESGVAENSMEAAMKARIEGGSLVLENVYGNVKVYNVAGTVVAETIADGNVTIPAANLPAGVYVVKTAKQNCKIVK